MLQVVAKKKRRAQVPRIMSMDAWAVINDPAEQTEKRFNALLFLPVAKQREIAGWSMERFYREKFYWELVQRAKRYAVRFICEGCGARGTPLWVRIRSWRNHGNEGAHLGDLSALCGECSEKLDQPKGGLRLARG